MTNQRQRTRLLEGAMADAMNDWATSAAEMVGNNLMLDLIERQQRRHLETMAAFDARATLQAEWEN